MAETRLKIDAEAEVSTTELAAIFGVTARRVQQMAQDGTIIPVRRGYFQLGDAVQRYINFLSKPQISEAEQKLETAKRQSEAQLKLSKAQLAKMEVEELKGKLHRSEDVEGFTEDLIYTIRGALLSLPGRLSVDVTAAQSPAEAAEIIRKEVHKVMRELAAYHYDPEKYAEKGNERRDCDCQDTQGTRAYARPHERGRRRKTLQTVGKRRLGKRTPACEGAVRALSSSFRRAQSARFV